MGVLEREILGGVGAPESTALENEWAAFVGRSTGLLFNSGTAAIHAALYGIDLRPGDEVITTSFTFAGTWQPILQQLGIPVFVDIDPRTYTLDAGQIEAKIGPRTRAIIAVHIQGLPCDMDEILDIADRHGLHVIEDACQAHGATYKGRQVGSMGTVGCYSLNSSKILTGGEGGLFVADDPDVIQRARRLRTFGEDIPELGKLTGWNFRPYTVHSVGWNYRHQEMPAALARSQLKRLPEYVATAPAERRVPDRAADRRARDHAAVHPARPDLELLRVPGPPRARRRSAWATSSRPSSGMRSARRCRPWASAASCGTREPAPAFPIFQNREGFGGQFPWTQPPAGRDITYDVADFPEATALLDSSLVICDMKHPIFVQPMEVIEAYAATIKEVLADPERIMETVGSPIPA